MADDLKGYKKMPKWMECGWRRIPCEKSDCPICGRIQQDRLRHIMAGENPDDVKSCLEDVSRNFKEVLAMIKKDCEAQGIEISNIDKIQEPPEPKEFPLYQKVKKWRDETVFFFDNPLNEFLIYTEAVQNILWYADTLLAKVYRQLCNKWHIENGDEYGEFDFQYTKHVLKECVNILKKSLRELERNNSSQKEFWTVKISEFCLLEKEIFKIAPNKELKTWLKIRQKKK